MAEEKKELTPQQRAEACQADLKASLLKYNCGIVGTPNFLRRDDGTFSVVVRVDIGPLNNTPVDDLVSDVKDK